MRCNLLIVVAVYSVFFVISGAKAQNFDLNTMVPVKNIKLHSIKDRYKISLPIPQRWKVKQATLRFRYSNSTALLSYKSRLVVYLDDVPLSQFVLDPKDGEKTARVDMPGRMLTPGYHSLTFEVAQHSERECEDPFAPELWSVIKLGEATLSVDYQKKAIPLSLSAIPEYIEDPKIFPSQKINLVIPSLDKEWLEIGAIVAGGLGARMQYRPVQITVSSQVTQNVDNVVIATRKDLSKLGVPHGTNSRGPWLEISHVPIPNTSNATQEQGVAFDTTHALILITGDDVGQVKKAALAVSSMSFPFPQGSYVQIDKTILPEIKPYHRKQSLYPGEPVRFKDLGFRTHVFKGMTREPEKLEFFLPSDLYIKPNQYAVLLLHFGFSSAVRKDSTMKIELNGKPVSSVHLDNENGAFYERYKILLPTYLFKPGKNVLSFESTLIPLIIKRCQGFHDMNLFLTLFDDSTILFPSMEHWGKMPEISYFFDSGFPFDREITGKGAAFLLLDKDFYVATLAMNLASYLGQVSGMSPAEISVVFDPSDAKDKDLMVIGQASRLPQNIAQKAPLGLFGQSAQIRYPQFLDLTQVSKRSMWQKLEEKLESYSRLFPVSARNQISEVHAQKVKLDEKTGLLMEFESPFSKGKSVLLWTGKDSAVFLSTSQMLWSGRLRSLASGDLVLYSVIDPQTVYSFKIGPDYYTGKLSKTEKVDFLLRSYPWLFYSVLGICFLVLAVIFGAYLRWRRKKRLANEI